VEYGLIGLYLAAVVIANLTIAAFGPSVAVINAFLLIALDLTSRDRLHEAWRGRWLWLRMGTLIATGSLLSYLLSRGAGRIALASFVAFAASGAVDAALYHLLRRRPWSVKVNGSNIVSAAVDSLVFPTLAFGGLLPWIVLGQFAAKTLGGLLWSVVLMPRDRRMGRRGKVLL
jgi:queuosine precursor transporter